MKRVESFFAPCFELLVWPELKNVLLISLATAKRSLLSMVNYFWRFGVLFLAIGILLPIIFLPTLQTLGFKGVYDFMRGLAPSSLSPFGTFFLLLINFACSYLFSLMIILFARPSREEKGLHYFFEILKNNKFFISLGFLVYSFFMATHFFSPFIGIWAFSVLFYLDGESTSHDLLIAVRKGFFGYMRFLPIIIIVQGFFEISFLILAGSTSSVVMIFAEVFSELGFLTKIVNALLIFLLVLGRISVSILTGLMPIVVINTLYIKVITRFKNYFA